MIIRRRIPPTLLMYFIFLCYEWGWRGYSLKSRLVIKNRKRRYYLSCDWLIYCIMQMQQKTKARLSAHQRCLCSVVLTILSALQSSKSYKDLLRVVQSINRLRFSSIMQPLHAHMIIIINSMQLLIRMPMQQFLSRVILRLRYSRWMNDYNSKFLFLILIQSSSCLYLSLFLGRLVHKSFISSYLGMKRTENFMDSRRGRQYYMKNETEQDMNLDLISMSSLFLIDRERSSLKTIFSARKANQFSILLWLFDVMILISQEQASQLSSFRFQEKLSCSMAMISIPQSLYIILSSFILQFSPYWDSVKQPIIKYSISFQLAYYRQSNKLAPKDKSYKNTSQCSPSFIDIHSTPSNRIGSTIQALTTLTKFLALDRPRSRYYTDQLNISLGFLPPTAQTTAHPDPSCIVELRNKKGSSSLLSLASLILYLGVSDLKGSTAFQLTRMYLYELQSIDELFSTSNSMASNCKTRGAEIQTQSPCLS